MDDQDRDDVMHRARAAHRRAESALSRMFGNFGRYEDDSRASRLLRLSLAREQETWIAAFGSPGLRELAAQANARDEAGRLISPWLHAGAAVDKRLLTEWQRAPAWVGARTPGQEWTAVPQTYDQRPNALRAYMQKQALRRATAAADALWRQRKQERRAPLEPSGKTTWRSHLGLERRPAGDLHEKLRAALATEWNAWVTVHGSSELKRMPSFHAREDGWPVHSDATALRGMRQLGSEWLAKEYPGWQFADGYRADGHRPTLGSDNSFWPIAPEHQRVLEGTLGMALAPPMAEATRIDPNAKLVILSESALSVRKQGPVVAEHPAAADPWPYVFGAVVERRLPGSWVKEPVMLVFEPHRQLELNAALATREHGLVARNPTAPHERDGSAPSKSTTPGNKPKSAADLLVLSTKEATMGELELRKDTLGAMREALARQYQKPVLPVPQGGSVEGRVVAAFSGVQPDRMRVVLESERAVHIIGVGADTARETLGQRVTVANERGKLTLSPLRLDQRPTQERTAPVTDRGR